MPVNIIGTDLLPLRRWLQLAGGLLVVAILLAYTAYQARFLLQGPQITLGEEPTIVQSDRSVTLTGSTRNIARITLNGRQIFTDETGIFEEVMWLENGYTIATLSAEDRYGRTTSLVRPFVYHPTPLITE